MTRQLFGQSLTGWRLSAVILSMSIWTLTAILSALLLGSVVLSVKQGGSVSGTTALFIGNCAWSNNIITILRVIISVFSTLILLSSNYFMQLVVTPTRGDIDEAHRRYQWMDIGIPSMRNLRFVSYKRGLLWLLLAATSVPFHLFFNASVYETDATNAYMTIFAAESFLSGAAYYLPGIGTGPKPTGRWALDNTETKHLRHEVQDIASNAASWERLSGSECVNQYSSNSGMQDRKHLVIVLDTDADGRGWTMSDKFHSLGGGPYNDTAYSVWYAAYCNTFHDVGKGPAWQNPVSDEPSGLAEPKIDFGGSPESLLDVNGTWKIHWTTSNETLHMNETLTVKYCLSEKVDGACKAHINNDIFFVVCLVVLAKSVLCVAALRHLWVTEPLATIGDAVDSFIRKPDLTTREMCTRGWWDFSVAARWRALQPSPVQMWDASPRQWRARRIFLGSSVHVSDWLRTYFLGMMALSLTVSCAYTLRTWKPSSTSDYGYSIFESYADVPALVGLNAELISESISCHLNAISQKIEGAFFMANLPQLGLSVMGFMLNVIYTRMFMAREWASYGEDFKPLRVSTPKGEQTSSSILQIPLPYAIALQSLGTFLHWLCAKSLYVVSSEVRGHNFNQTDDESPSKVIGFGVSDRWVFTFLIVLSVALLLPIIAAFIPLKRNTVVVGSCSAAISAACHVVQPPSRIDSSALAETPTSPWAVSPSGSSVSSPCLSKEGAYESVPLTDIEHDSAGKALDWRAEVAERKLKWGDVAGVGVPSKIFDDDTFDVMMVGHLTFGTEENDVRDPFDGSWYAGVMRSDERKHS